MVVVTPIVSVAFWPPPPVMVNVQLPAATGVTENEAAVAAEIVAIPVQVVPDAVKAPLKLLCVTVTVCALLAPVAVNASDDDESMTLPGVGAAVGVGVGPATNAPAAG